MIRKLINIDWNSPTVKVMDWGLAAASLITFVLTEDLLWLLGAAVGSAAAWYRPMARVQTFFNSLVRRRVGR